MILHVKGTRQPGRLVAFVCVKREGKYPVYLLSDHVWIMTCLDLEGTILGPKIN